MNKNSTFKLGRSITQIIPFYRQRQPEQQPKQQKEILTTKLVLVDGNNSDSKDRCSNIYGFKT
jgi:hypothetical protein